MLGRRDCFLTGRGRIHHQQRQSGDYSAHLDQPVPSADSVR